MTIPNLLTLARLALTPVIAILAYSTSAAVRTAALGLFLLAMATDVVDGVIAKRAGQASVLGLYLDPVTDKIILVTMFFLLADFGLVPLWIALLMMAREFLVDGLRQAGAVRGQVVGANVMGKTKAALQTGCIVLGLAVRAAQADAALWRPAVTAASGFTLLLAWLFAGVFLWQNRLLLKEANDRQSASAQLPPEDPPYGRPAENEAAASRRA